MLQAGPTAPETWARVWADVARVEAAPADSAARRAGVERLGAQAAALQRDSGSGRDPVLAYRLALLRWHVERLAGRSARVVTAPRATFEWAPGEPWAAARGLRAGPLRAAAVVTALGERGAPDMGARVERAEQVLREDLSGVRLVEALRVAEALDARLGTRAAALRHAEVLVRSGRGAEADALLRARLARAEEAAEEAELRVALARVALGSGAERAARDELGAALALGSGDAARILARLALAAGARERARRLARSATSSDAEDAGLLLWGLALLPAGAAPPGGPAPLR